MGQLITVALINITVRKYKQLSKQLRTMHRLYATEHMYVYMDIGNWQVTKDVYGLKMMC